MSTSFDVFLPKTYNLPTAYVEFDTSDKELKRLYDEAEEICKNNIRKFSDYNVLIEGAKYNGMWLETQPLSGEMYSKRNVETALSNILIFLRYQRKDGRLPGMLKDFGQWGGISAHFDWIQGLFLAYPALKMYYHIGKNNEYLELLYNCLEDFDNYMWKYRDSDNDGCLESWCVFDTGEDNSTIHMLNGLSCSKNGHWGYSYPPDNFGNMPYESPQFMAYSYSCRDVLSKISSILGNGKAKYWKEKATLIKDKVKDYLWDDERKCVFHRDRNNKVVKVLTQENKNVCVWDFFQKRWQMIL